MKLKVFYRPEQSVADNDSFSPSAQKPRLLLDYWKKLGLPIEVETFRPLKPSEIALAHSKDYVRGILNCTIPNGFGNTSKKVAKSLPFTTGSVYAAAKHAVKTGESVCSPTSSFHHAGWSNASGFCTFSASVITARLLKREGLIKKLGVWDLDQHAGNSVVEITKHLGIKYIKQWSLGYSDVNSDNVEEFLAKIPQIIMETFKDCDVLLYGAGADSHISDPLGGRFTTEQMKERDRITFETCKKMGLPVVWQLYGGYQSPIQKVLDLHTNTLREALQVYNRLKH